jgi:hypothetical protein
MLNTILNNQVPGTLEPELERERVEPYLRDCVTDEELERVGRRERMHRHQLP